MNLVLKDISHEYAAEFTRWIADKQAIKYTLSKFLPLRDIQWVKSYITSLIEDSTTWNQGLGSLAGHKVLEHGFSVLDFHRIWLTVSELNPGAIKSYENLGFAEEGRMRDACFRDNAFHNKIVMSILEERWLNNRMDCLNPL